MDLPTCAVAYPEGKSKGYKSHPPKLSLVIFLFFNRKDKNLVDPSDEKYSMTKKQCDFSTAGIVLFFSSTAQ